MRWKGGRVCESLNSQLPSPALVWPPGISLRKPLNLGAEPSVDIGLGMSVVRGRGGRGDERMRRGRTPVPIRAARLIRRKPHRVNFWRKRDADVEHHASVLATRPDSADGGDASFSVSRAEQARRPVRTWRPDEWMWLNLWSTWLKSLLDGIPRSRSNCAQEHESMIRAKKKATAGTLF